MNFYLTQCIRNSRLSATLILSAVVAGCSSCSNSGSTPVSAQPAELQGVWERTGYGDVLVVDDTGGELFQYTRQGCLNAETLDNAEMADVFAGSSLSDDGDSLTTNPEGDPAFEFRLSRLSELPSLCASENLIELSSPVATFEHLWHTFNDYYAFFNERGVDWDRQYAELRPLVNESLSDDELVEVIDELLSPLDDGHILLSAGNEEYDFADFRGANKVIIDNFPLQTEYDDLQDYANAVSISFRDIRSGYLDAGSEKSSGGENGRRVTWGTINQQVGYLRVSRMQDLTPDGQDSVVSELLAIDRIMQAAMSDLQDTSALIIDVRPNGGGYDAVSLAIAGYFTSETRQAVSKRARSYLGETAVIDAYITPANDTPYLNPISILASADTGSAAEIFLMAMSALPNTTLVGENSNGILSDILSKSLPNGWEVGLSNEVYTDSTGVAYEVIGVPPAVPAAAFSLEAIAQGKDEAIDAALQTLGY